MAIAPDDSKTEKLKQIDELLEARRNRLYAWDRFGIRHMAVWITSVALLLSLYRLFFAFSLVRGGQSLLESWNSVEIQRSDIEQAVAYGSVLGLGIPAAFGFSRHSEFWRHPARVLFAYLVVLVFLDTLTLAVSLDLFGIDYTRGELVMTVGLGAACIIWTSYVAVRCRVAWYWKCALILFWVVQVGQTVEHAWWILFRFRQGFFVSAREDFSRSLVVLACFVACGLYLIAISFWEYYRGRYRDWRTMSLALISILGLISMNWHLVYELWRSVKLDAR